MPPRTKLTTVTSLDDVLELLRTRRQIIVITGAGISVSCGIPDFRSKDGLYNTLDCSSFGIPSAELLFDLEFFEIDPQPFYRFASSLLPNDTQPSLAHHFLGTLSGQKKLLRNYTQNVDGLERKVPGLNHNKQLIECHGSMAKFKCTKCRFKTDLNEELASEVRKGNVVYCSSKSCTEVLKPNITFFGEPLPSSLGKSIEKDLPICDLVLVIGTSLKVGGSVVEIIKRIDPSVPQILINKECVKLPAFSEGFDVSILGQCDEVVQYLCQRLGWTCGARTGAVAGAAGAGANEAEPGLKRKRDTDDLALQPAAATSSSANTTAAALTCVEESSRVFRVSSSQSV